METEMRKCSPVVEQTETNMLTEAMATMALPSVPSNLQELLDEVKCLREKTPTLTGAQALLDVVRKHHFWPAIQVKKFYHDPHLVLVHNTYRRVDVAHFQQLYDECRSVVLDMRTVEASVIVTFAHQIPDRLVDAQYRAVCESCDRCEASYEGTVITVYHHEGKWLFGTTSCPSADSSRFRHQDKTHGEMFQEALAQLFPTVEAVCTETAGEQPLTPSLQEEFTKHLEPERAYAFLLVHHENTHVMNYTPTFGRPDYAKLVHIGTRDRLSLQELPLTDQPLASLGMQYPTRFASPAEAVARLVDDPQLYGIMVTRADGRRFKVSRKEVVHREEVDYGHPNLWLNMLWVYMQNRPDYHIQDYVQEYGDGLVCPKDARGKEMAPTYLIHTAICTIRDVLFQLYAQTTKYFPNLKRFKMDKELDARYDPILRFHLAQLRHVQVTHHTHAFLNHKALYHYLCFHQSLKNVRALIEYFAKNPMPGFPGRTREVFQLLHTMLTQHENKK